MMPVTRRAFLGSAAAAVAAASVVAQAADEPTPIRIGMIGLDTSHAPAFAKLFNAAAGARPELQNLRLTAAFPAGNPAFPLSRDRLAGFTREVRDLGVEIVPSLEALFPLVDVVLLESVDGTQHWEQAQAVFAAGKPVFIDKPLAASLADVLKIADLGQQHAVPWFTASSSRFTAGYPELRHNDRVGEILGCDTYSLSRAAIGHPDLFWYGVHGVDLLYSLLGTGCQSVTAVQTQFSEQVSGTWSNGRVGTYRAIREHTGKTGLGATVFGTAGIVHVNNYYDYVPLVLAIAKFFRTREAPIPVEEMVEVFAYLAAAEESKRRRGVPVKLAEVIATART
ncbi:MAG: Gfo/Idh/MocA family oxidoreductase [Planctomycetes bacterium]|nr:Gfo/Idh/MocA family oxidoreductase [Planctomycetota bacterium]